MNHAQLKEAALSRRDVKIEYEALETEFQLLRQMLAARAKAGLSQAGVAARMGTQASAVARLESSLSIGKHSPSIKTLKQYAKAMGYELQIKFVKRKSKKTQSKNVPQLQG